MSKEKQMIKEMAKVIKSSLDGLGCGNFNFTADEIGTMFAEALYNAGYRKQSEGEWIVKGECWKALQCSACGHTADTIYDKSPFCPNCGAKMKGGGE